MQFAREGFALEDQLLDDALTGHEHPIGQEHADVRIASAGSPAGIQQSSLIGQTLHK